MSAEAAEDAALTKELEELRRKFVGGKTTPGNVIAAWKAIRRVGIRNKQCQERGKPPYPLPDWLNEYLLRSADKIERLWLGIAPDDDRPIGDMASEVGMLRRVRNGNGTEEKFRDDRPKHAARALGFVGNGWSAFQRWDRSEADESTLRIHDNPELVENKPFRDEVRRRLRNVIAKQEGLSEASIKNRLSRARSASREREK